VPVPLTWTSAWCSMLPSSEEATHVYVAVCRTSVSLNTFRPNGASSSGVRSTAPRRQRIVGIGDPTATHVRFTDPPGSTSTLSGAMEKCGGTRRTAATHQITLVHSRQVRSGHLHVPLTVCTKVNSLSFSHSSCL